MINLLPEEMRKREQMELAKQEEKKFKRVEIAKPVLDKELVGSKKGQGFFSFLKSFLQKKPKQPEKGKTETRVKAETKTPEPPASVGLIPKPGIPKSETLAESSEKAKQIITPKKGEKVLPKEAVGGGLEISLMPSVKPLASSLIRRRQNIFLAGVVLALIIVCLVWLGFKTYYGNVLAQIQKTGSEINIVKEQTQQYLSLRDEIIALDKRANRAEKILSQHTYWSKFFNLLDTYTVPGVFYNSFSADRNGRISLAAVAKDIESVIQQLASFQQAPDFVKYILVNNIRQPDKKKGVNFTLELNLIEDFFSK